MLMMTTTLKEKSNGPKDIYFSYYYYFHEVKNNLYIEPVSFLKRNSKKKNRTEWKSARHNISQNTNNSFKIKKSII